MKRIVCLLFAALVAMAGAYSEISVPRLWNTELEFDGVPDDDVWARAAQIRDFKIFWTDKKAPDYTTVMMFLDKENLYFGLICQEPVEVFESPTGSPWSSDNVEVFFGNTGAAQWYCQIVFTPGMKRYNEIIENSQYRLATKVEKNRWTAEMIIPLKYLGEMPDGVFRFNMLRGRTKAKSSEREFTVADIFWAHEIDSLCTMRIYTPATEITHGPWTFGISSDFAGINWETAGQCAAFIFMRKQGEKDFKKISADVEAGTQLRNRTLHTVCLSKLEPDTVYEYHTGDGKIRTFRTLNLDSGNFSFAMTSDIHSHLQNLDNVLNNKEVMNSELLFFNGDISSAFIGRFACYESYLDTIIKSWDKPFYLIRGNHEYRGGAAADFFDVFAPHNRRSYYSFKHKGVFFVTLDTDSDMPEEDDTYIREQTEWLKKTVHSSDFLNADFRVLISHTPYFRSERIKEMMNGIMKEAGKNFDLMLHGHVHCYCKAMPGAGELVSENPKYNKQIIDFEMPCPVLTNCASGIITVNKEADKMTVFVMNNNGQELDRVLIQQ